MDGFLETNDGTNFCPGLAANGISACGVLAEYGFTQEQIDLVESVCVASCGTCWCADEPAGWIDTYNDDCAAYEQNGYCSDYGDACPDENGVTANQACCTCGGGARGALPTPFPTPFPTSFPTPTPTRRADEASLVVQIEMGFVFSDEVPNGSGKREATKEIAAAVADALGLSVDDVTCETLRYTDEEWLYDAGVTITLPNTLQNREL